ncbi:MAG TPA: pyrroloquinoline quinone-dependent dehydrogenase [Terriglobia bacterium]|nr:pyrroloquinoline quinone-dependent dehydrogenase [Terriglobia bacterium]
MQKGRRLVMAGVVTLLFSLTVMLSAQYGVKNAEWPVFGGDLGSTRYSPLDQINRDNVNTLQVAWTFKTDNYAPAPVPQSESTPIMVKGVLYFTAGPRRNVIALDAGTGETLWVYRPDEGVRGDRAPRKNTRGVSYWTDGREERIILVTPGFHLIALDARTGHLVSGFGKSGIVDLFEEMDLDYKGDLAGQLGNSSPAVVSNDTIIVGAALPVGTRVNKENVKGDVLAFDVRTGKRKWAFHTIPRKGEPGYETWKTGAEFTGNAAVWTTFSADEELGYVYLPVEAPTHDTYGGHRHGDNLYSSSLVCVDIRTGKPVWHFQHTHHDIWDRDTPSAPILVDLRVDGRPVKAVVLLTKQAFAFVFDRTNGHPVWPIEERPVPPSDVPGEVASPTQPFPTRPPAFDLQGVSTDDLIDFTPALREQALAAVRNYRLGPLFTPPSLAAAPDGTRGLMMVPQFNGGANWEGGAADPETGFVYVGTARNFSTLALVPSSGQVTSDYILSQSGPRGPDGLPLLKPPYGQIVAYDMNKGEIAWRAANGDTPPNIKNHEALRGLNIPATGSVSHAGLLVTRTLLFAGEGLTGQPYFRAHDKKTGKVLWETRIPTGGSQSGLPMTYMLNGRQYVVFAASGTDGSSAQLIAYATASTGGRGAGARAGGNRGRSGRAPRGRFRNSSPYANRACTIHPLVASLPPGSPRGCFPANGGSHGAGRDWINGRRLAVPQRRSGGNEVFPAGANQRCKRQPVENRLALEVCEPRTTSGLQLGSNAPGDRRQVVFLGGRRARGCRD